MPFSVVEFAEPLSQRPTLSVVMPQSMMVKGSVMTSGGELSAGRGGCLASAVSMVLRAAILAGQIMRSDRRHADRPGVAVIEQGVPHFLPRQEEQVVGRVPEAGVAQQRGQLAHLAPEHAHRPMLDVEIMVLDVGEDGAREAELAVEGRLRLGRQQCAIFGGDAVAFGSDFGGRAIDILAFAQTARRKP